MNLLSTMKWKTIIISFLISANFPASGISVTKARMAGVAEVVRGHGGPLPKSLGSDKNFIFPASSLLWKLHLNAIVSTLQISTGYCMFWSLVTWWISEFSCLWPTLKSIPSYIIQQILSYSKVDTWTASGNKRFGITRPIHLATAFGLRTQLYFGEIIFQLIGRGKGFTS